MRARSRQGAVFASTHVSAGCELSDCPADSCRGLFIAGATGGHGAEPLDVIGPGPAHVADVVAGGMVALDVVKLELLGVVGPGDRPCREGAATRWVFANAGDVLLIKLAPCRRELVIEPGEGGMELSLGLSATRAKWFSEFGFANDGAEFRRDDYSSPESLASLNQMLQLPRHCRPILLHPL